MGHTSFTFSTYLNLSRCTTARELSKLSEEGRMNLRLNFVDGDSESESHIRPRAGADWNLRQSTLSSRASLIGNCVEARRDRISKNGRFSRRIENVVGETRRKK